MPLRVAVLLMATILSFTPPAAWTQSPVAGNWQGVMKVDGTKLHLVLHIRQAQDGTFSAVIDSLNQDSANIPVQTVKFDVATLRLDIAQVGAIYVGSLSKDGKEQKCVWSEGKDRSLTFKRVPDSVSLAQPVEVGGQWEGTFNEDGVQRGVHLYIDTRSCTALVGKLYVLNGSEWMAITVPKITFQNGSLAFSVKSPRLTYSGTLNNSDFKFEGVWKEDHSYPLTLQRVSQVFGDYEPPKGCRG